MKNYLKHIFPASVVLAMLGCISPGMPVLAENTSYSGDEIIYESFDNGYDGFSVDKNITVSTVSGKFGNAVKIEGFYEYKSIHKIVQLGANRRYKVSYWVKGVKNYSGIHSCILMNKNDYHVNSLGNTSTAQISPNFVYAGIPGNTNQGVELSADWQYVEEYVSFSSSGMTDELGTTNIYPMLYKVGGVGENYTISKPYLSFQKVAFCIDELKIEPLDIVENGNMDDVSGFTFNDNTNAYVTNEYGNNILVMTNKTGGGADMCRLVDIREGETYQISYRAKTCGGTNHAQVLFTRSSGLYSTNPTPLYESVQADEVTNEWQTFSHQFTSQVKTTDSLAYRSPEMIFRIKDKGSVYVDDLKIEKINTAVKNVTIRGICKPGERIGVWFNGNGSPTYRWRIADTDYFRTISEGSADIESFSFEIPSGFSSLAVCIAPVSADGLIGIETRTVINDIEPADYSVNEVNDAQTIGAEWPDTVWPSDFSEVRTKITVKNKNEKLYGILALYDGQSGKLTDISMQPLGDGANIISCPTESGSFARAMVIDEAFSPKMQTKKLAKDDKSAFIYVSPNAGEAGKGTFDSPADILGALSIAKNRAKDTDGNVYVMLKADEYKLADTLKITAEQSGVNGNVIFCSYGGENGEKATISGGIEVSGWEVYDSAKNIYRAKVEDESIENFRQLYINGSRATRARSDIAPMVAEKTDEGYILNDVSLLNLSQPDDAEFVYFQEWTNPRCGIESVTDNGDGTSTVIMNNYCWTQFLRKRYLEPQAPSYVENAYEFLDTQGEWYFNKNDRYVYYMPRTFEDMTSAKATVPTVETLLSIGGTYTNPVKNIIFKNLEFAYSTWIYPDTYGYSDAQAGKLRDRLDENGNGDDPCPDAAVEVTHADNVNFEDCTFNKLGMSAVSMLWGITNCRISGSRFGDISGSGIYLGTPYKDDVCTNWRNDICRNISIENNYFHDLALDYKSCVPISTIHMYDVNISHNEIFNVPYSGIHGESGIGTDRTGHTYNENFLNRVLNDVTYDGGSIYVTGKSGAASEPWNEIKGNYIKNQLNGYAGLYTDNKSSGWMLSDNVIDFSGVDKWSAGKLQWFLNIGSSNIFADNNYTTTDGINILKDFWEDTAHTQADYITNTHVVENAEWNDEALNIIENAGLSDEYDARLTEKYRISVPKDKEMTVKKGMSKEIMLYGVGGKKGIFSAEAPITVISDTPNIVTASNGTITGKNPGEGQVRVYTLSDGCLKSEIVKVRVY